MLTLPTTLDTKASGFGYGDKNGLMMLTGRDSPSPNCYRLRGNFEKLRFNNGKSFGMPHSVYSKVYNPNNKITSLMVECPGPGAYEVKNLVGTNAKKFSMKSRIKPVDTATRDNPPPNTYHPNYSVYEASKFQAITFGFGTKCNVTGQIQETPGPGTYRVPSVFDKFKRLPPKEYQQLKNQRKFSPDKQNDDEGDFGQSNDNRKNNYDD